MVFVTGPLCSGKRTFAQKLGGRQVYDVQDLAADAADSEHGDMRRMQALHGRFSK